jgi:5'(3')-deoxyribonucleotidase
MDNAWHTLEAIQNELGNKIIITTKPWWSKECMSAKLWWLEKYMPFLDVYSQVIFLSDKSMLNNNNIIIDDCPDHLEGYGGIKIKAEWPYNKSCDCDYSFTDWTNVYSFVQEINSEEK